MTLVTISFEEGDMRSCHYTITPNDVQYRALDVLQAALRLADHGPKCTARAVLTVLAWAAACGRSIAPSRRRARAISMPTPRPMSSCAAAVTPWSCGACGRPTRGRISLATC